MTDASSVSFISATDQKVEDPADYFALLKPRVMSLVIFTGICGLILAPGEIHPFQAFIAILSLAVGAGASGALNMWFDRDIDQIMVRTQNRPIPAGRIEPQNALVFGLLLSGLSVMTMGLATHWFAAAGLAFTIAYYVLFYTMWLKRRTAQNIVIGGAAGAFPPVLGWICVTNSLDWGAISLFTLIFFWTPPHFWALALFRYDDYEKAKVPMLPATAGSQVTRQNIFVYSLSLLPISILPSLIGPASGIYALFAVTLTGIFAGASYRLLRHPSPEKSLQLFKYSILLLFSLFTALLIDHYSVSEAYSLTSMYHSIFGGDFL